MQIFKVPAWVKKHQYNYKSFEEIPSAVFDEINRKLDKVQSKSPEVSIVIPAWNEEINVLRCVASLAEIKTKIPFEIIVVNNNSTDRTQDTIDNLHVKGLFEGTQGSGPARQTGQENAAGKYILSADADCLYPSCWVDEMIKVLRKPGVVCVYGRYSFISEKGFPRWKLFLLEKMKDVIAEFRHLNRPYFNAYGISMGYIKEYGLKVGIIRTRFLGEDGKLCLDLMPYGKVLQVRSNKARAWTGPRALQRHGNFSEALMLRINKEIKRFMDNFHSRLAHDPHDKKFSKQ
ncbi:glycosyltransferase family A protein [Pontibacter brevis]